MINFSHLPVHFLDPPHDVLGYRGPREFSHVDLNVGRQPHKVGQVHRIDECGSRAIREPTPELFHSTKNDYYLIGEFLFLNLTVNPPSMSVKSITPIVSKLLCSGD